MKTLELIELAANQWNIKFRVQYSSLDLTIEDLEGAINEINIQLRDTVPVWIKVAKDGLHATIYNAAGVELIYNQKVANEYSHLTDYANKNHTLTPDHLKSAKKVLLKHLAYKKQLPVFLNGKFYAETKRALSGLI